MATNILNETVICLREAAKRIPPTRLERPTTLACMLRQITHGRIGPDGERVRLEAVRFGGRWLTSIEAMARYAERLTPRLGDADTPPTPTKASKARAARAKAVEKELEKMGL